MADAFQTGVAEFSRLIRDLQLKSYSAYDGLDEEQAQHECRDFPALDAMVLRSITAHLQAQDQEQRRGYLRALVYVLSNLAIDCVPSVNSPRFTDAVLRTMPGTQGGGQ